MLFFETESRSGFVTLNTKTDRVSNVFDNGYQHVRGYGDPHLCLDGILGSAEEALDTQVLLDPSKKSSTCQRLL